MLSKRGENTPKVRERDKILLIKVGNPANYYIFIVLKYRILQHIQAMITEDKIIEIFCIIDEFCQNFASECEKNLVWKIKNTVTVTARDG